VRIRSARFSVEGILSKEKVPLSFFAVVSYGIDFRVAERLRSQVAYFTEEQWKELVATHLEAALTNEVRAYSVLGVIGSDRVDWSAIQSRVMTHLADTLQQWAVVLDEEQGVMLNKVELPQRLEEALVRARTAGIDTETGMHILASVQHAYPDIPMPVLLELLGSLQGQASTQRMILSSGIGPVSVGGTEPPTPSKEESRRPLVDDAKRRGIRVVKEIAPRPEKPEGRGVG
jgi:hypothetical protein